MISDILPHWEVVSSCHCVASSQLNLPWGKEASNLLSTFERIAKIANPKVDKTFRQGQQN